MATASVPSRIRTALKSVAFPSQWGVCITSDHDKSDKDFLGFVGVVATNGFHTLALVRDEYRRPWTISLMLNGNAIEVAKFDNSDVEGAFRYFKSAVEEMMKPTLKNYVLNAMGTYPRGWHEIMAFMRVWGCKRNSNHSRLEPPEKEYSSWLKDTYKDRKAIRNVVRFDKGVYYVAYCGKARP